jgi:branched-subunit amino acid permease
MDKNQLIGKGTNMLYWVKLTLACMVLILGITITGAEYNGEVPRFGYEVFCNTLGFLMFVVGGFFVYLIIEKKGDCNE